MSSAFFEKPVLNSPYEYPSKHWELDDSGQPTSKIVDARRRAQFITPIPKPKKRRTSQKEIVFDEGKGLSTEEQAYDPTSLINQVRDEVDAWRALENPSDWNVSPETARLLRHWRHHRFADIRQTGGNGKCDRSIRRKRLWPRSSRRGGRSLGRQT